MADQLRTMQATIAGMLTQIETALEPLPSVAAPEQEPEPETAAPPLTAGEKVAHSEALSREAWIERRAQSQLKSPF